MKGGPHCEKAWSPPWKHSAHTALVGSISHVRHRYAIEPRFHTAPHSDWRRAPGVNDEAKSAFGFLLLVADCRHRRMAAFSASLWSLSTRAYAALSVDGGVAGIRGRERAHAETAAAGVVPGGSGELWRRRNGMDGADHAARFCKRWPNHERAWHRCRRL